MEACDIQIGMTLYYGVERPRKVVVVGEPHMVSARWVVPIEYVTGTREDVPLTLLLARQKLPSARRGREPEVCASLREVVDAFNEVAPEEDRITPELFEDRMKRWGMR